jgi:hypothetical protein
MTVGCAQWRGTNLVWHVTKSDSELDLLSRCRRRTQQGQWWQVVVSKRWTAANDGGGWQRPAVVVAGSSDRKWPGTVANKQRMAVKSNDSRGWSRWRQWWRWWLATRPAWAGRQGQLEPKTRMSPLGRSSGQLNRTPLTRGTREEVWTGYQIQATHVRPHSGQLSDPVTQIWLARGLTHLGRLSD